MPTSITIVIGRRSLGKRRGGGGTISSRGFTGRSAVKPRCWRRREGWSGGGPGAVGPGSGEDGAFCGFEMPPRLMKGLAGGASLEEGRGFGPWRI